MGLFTKKSKQNAPHSNATSDKGAEEKNTRQREALKYAQNINRWFAKRDSAQTIHDPTGKTSRRANRTFTTYDKATIEGYLESPTSSEKDLRNASIFLYQTNGRYRSLLHYYANLPSWIYVMSALNYNPDKVKEEAYKKQYYKVSNLLESMGVIKTMREITLVALREGVYFGVRWGGDGNYYILQKLNPDNCSIVSLTDGGVFQFAYDMSQVKEGDLDTHYPPEFKTMWNEYRSSGNQWQLVPSDIGVCLKADPTVPEYSIPPFSAILPEVYTIENMEALFEAATELSNYKMISGLIPTDEDGVPLMDYDTAMQYYHHIASNVGDRVGVAIAPFELQDHDFEQSGTSAQVDRVSRATNNFFASAGTTAAIHGESGSASGVIKLAVKVDESYAFGYMYQCEKIINRFLKTLSGTQKFKITFLPVSIFNREEMLSKYKEALNYGAAKLQYLVTLGIPQHDVLNLNYIEKTILDIDNNFTPLKTSSTQSSDTSSSGRPLTDDTELEEAGEATRANDSNANR